MAFRGTEQGSIEPGKSIEETILNITKQLQDHSFYEIFAYRYKIIGDTYVIDYIETNNISEINIIGKDVMLVVRDARPVFLSRKQAEDISSCILSRATSELSDSIDCLKVSEDTDCPHTKDEFLNSSKFLDKESKSHIKDSARLLYLFEE